MTNRTLVLLRHAKADRPEGVADFDRPLTRRGRADATAAGGWLVDRGLLPDLVVCSPARRAKETWHGVASALPTAPDVRYDAVVYDATTADLLGVVKALPETARTVLLVGHNPGFEDLSLRLDPAAGSELRTAGIAVHTVVGNWSTVDTSAARRTAEATPRG